MYFVKYQIVSVTLFLLVSVTISENLQKNYRKKRNIHDGKRGLLRNLALNKVANQSSTYDNYYASKAVDGIRQANWVVPYCSHTNSEYNPFWFVDLGAQHDIKRIEIVNRRDYGDRLRDVSVVIAQRKGIFDQTCAHYSGPGKKVPVLHFRCPKGTSGRYVKVQVATYPKTYLTLCEVEVYGY